MALVVASRKSLGVGNELGVALLSELVVLTRACSAYQSELANIRKRRLQESAESVVGLPSKTKDEAMLQEINLEKEISGGAGFAGVRQHIKQRLAGLQSKPLLDVNAYLVQCSTWIFAWFGATCQEGGEFLGGRCIIVHRPGQTGIKLSG